MFLLAPILFGAEELLVIPGIMGHTGGILAYAQRSEPKTFNPIINADYAAKEVLRALHADLIHINRLTQQTEPALAKSWTVSPDGLHYVLNLRQGLRFSDGQKFDADDVVFSFQLYMDEKVDSPQRDLLILEGKPIVVRKVDAYKVAFDLPMPYAVAERLFDGFYIVPRHLLEKPYREGKLTGAWALGTPPSQIAGLGPFRLKDYIPGQRVRLERNPYYWKADTAGHRLPYLDELDFSFAGSEDGQMMRFQSGESDVLNRISARNFAVVEKDQGRRGLTVKDAGPGLEVSFLIFNLNQSVPPEIAAHQKFLHRLSFRQAVSAAIDRDAMVRLIFMGHADPMAGPEPRGNLRWVDAGLERPARSVARAREILALDHFSWTPAGALKDPDGRLVEFSIITSSTNAERTQMAVMIQDDLKAIGAVVHVVPLDVRSQLDRLQRTHDFDTCLLGFLNPDADPNPNMLMWLSSGGNHFWNPEQKTPATSWETEIDTLMRRQMVTRSYDQRKKLYDRVQELLMQNLPLIPLVNPHILVAARGGLLNFRPAGLDPSTFWNLEQLSWQQPAGTRR